MKLKKIDGTYYVQFRTADKKTKSVSTHCTNERDAKTVAEESGIKELELAARAGRLTAEAIGHITTGRKLNMTKAIEEFPTYLRAVGRSEKTINNYMVTLHAWVKQSGIGHLPPSLVTENHISPFINDTESTAKAHSRKTNLAAISSFFDWCMGNGWASRRPTKNVRIMMNTLSHAQKEKNEKLPFDREEIRTLLRATQSELPFWYFAITTSFNYALRLGDICNLEWSCFDKAGKMIVWTGKRDKRVAVPISDSFTEFVSTIPVLDAQFIWPQQREIINDMNKRNLLSMQFTRLCEKHGIKGKSFHNLRHTRITEWAKQGKTLEDIGELVGHSSAHTTAGYVHTK